MEVPAFCGYCSQMFMFGFRSIVPIIQELLSVFLGTLTADLVNYLAAQKLLVTK